MEKNKTRDDLNPPGLKSRDSSRAEKAQYRSSGGLKPLGGFRGIKKIFSARRRGFIRHCGYPGHKKRFLAFGRSAE